MRFPRLYWLIAPLGALALAATSCQSAQKRPALLIPARAAPPRLASSAPEPPNATAKSTEQQSQPPEVHREPLPDAVAGLIAKVEKEYDVAQASYQAGNLEAAKQSFDSAFELLLSAPVEIRSDARLEEEFQKLLDAENGLEITASQEGEGLEQKSEPAPIDEANAATPAVDPKIKAQAEAEIKETRSDLPLILNDTVASYINYFSSRGHDVLARGLTRSGQYDEMIRRTLKEEGVPQDLIYLAQAESGFHPLALSRAGARGMWQFMSSRARGYGLKKSGWVDERQDPEKATRAAARHLKDLYRQFGDWYLAMAAYNSGPGTVQKAVKRTGYADFWELYRRNVLPKETRNYVPIILAVTIMAKNPAQYGLEDVVPDKPVASDSVKIDYPVDLRLVAGCVDVSAAELQDLNPSLLRMTTPKDREFTLRLPAGTKEKYLSAIAAIPPGDRMWWRYHIVRDGDSLTAIAKSYRTTAKAIAEENHLEEARLAPESKLIIPIAPGKHAMAEDGASYARHATPYKVRKGDTVASVAENFGVPPQMVRRWNRLKADGLGGRRVIYVHLPITRNLREQPARASTSHREKAATLAQVSSQAKVVHHKVKQGETLSSIATSYKTTVSALKRDNSKVANLRPGMILIIRDLK